MPKQTICPDCIEMRRQLKEMTKSKKKKQTGTVIPEVLNPKKTTKSVKSTKEIYSTK